MAKQRDDNKNRKKDSHDEEEESLPIVFEIKPPACSPPVKGKKTSKGNSSLLKTVIVNKLLW